MSGGAKTGSSPTGYIGNGTFAAVSTFLSNPAGLIVDAKTGDFNNDGFKDLVISSRISNTVSTLISNGDGTFSNRTDYALSNSSAAMITVADFTGDGKLDFAVCTLGFFDVFVGDGLGSFALNASYIVGTSSYGITSVDVDKDGDIDIIASRNFLGEQGFKVFRNNGTGSFIAGGTFATAGVNLHATTGDFNKDGNIDVAVFATSAVIEIHLGDGLGGFTLSSSLARSGTYAEYSAAVDINSDGRLDIITVNCDYVPTDSVDVFTGNSDGTFNAPVSYPVGTCGGSLQIGDFNGDNRPDIAVAVYADQNITILFNDGDGLFGNVTPNNVMSTGASFPWGLIALDANQDRKLDLLFTDYESNNIGVFLGN